MRNMLYYGDNLEILIRHISDNSVDLIYLDPPFNSKANYNVLYKKPTGEPSKAQVTAFEDKWHWTEESERAFHDIAEKAPPQVVDMMTAFRQFIKENNMMSYLTMMCIRLLELKRVLKDTGLIYLHCDPTASHYLKILMDTIFGAENFRNEIAWCYRGGGYPKKDFGRRHDIIFRYSKSDDYIFDVDEVRDEYAETTKERFDHYIGNIRKGRDFGTQTLNPFGKFPDDWWELQPIAPSAKERLGYPTQKPEKLLDKIIKASSKENDIILDPFCGCGTTVAVAQRLKRQWIGIDVTHLAINLIKWRLKHLGLEPKKDYQVIGEPEDFSGAKELASQNRYQFQWWALSLINARPYADKKKGADTGIDGYIYFMEEKDKVGKVIVPVKSGNTSVKDIRDLGHVLEREKAEIAVFISLNEATEPMKKEAITKGFYKSQILKKDYPRIQILTIAEIFGGKQPSIPYQLNPYKNTEIVDNSENLSLDFDQ
jgi:site-specific DNA-methyltransferase (adenine-specific)